MAIVYKGITQKLKDAGIQQTTLRDAGIISQSTFARIRYNQSVSLDTINTICQLLHCTPNDIIEITYDD